MRDEEAYYNYNDEDEKSYKKQGWARNFYNFFSRETDYEDEYEDEEAEETNLPKKQVITIWNEIKSLSDAKAIVENLRSGAPQIVNFENSPDDVAIDIRNFLYGAVYSLDANIGKISEKNIILTPKGISIENSSVKNKLGAFKFNGSNF